MFESQQMPCTTRAVPVKLWKWASI